MNCAWCSSASNGTHGICDACMLKFFSIDPATIHAEIAAEETQTADDYEQVCPVWQQLHYRNINSPQIGNVHAQF